jgi:hypothetical protein
MLIKPVADEDFMNDKELAAVRSAGHEKVVAKNATASAVTEKNSVVMLLAWAAVLVPIIYGIWSTAQKAWSLFS